MPVFMVLDLVSTVKQAKMNLAFGLGKLASYFGPCALIKIILMSYPLVLNLTFYNS